MTSDQAKSGGVEDVLLHPQTCSTIPPSLIEAIANSPSFSDETRGQARDFLCAIRKTRERAPPSAPPELVERTLLPTTAGPTRRSIFDLSGNKAKDYEGRRLRTEGEPPCPDAIANDLYDNYGKILNFFQNVFRRNSFDDNGKEIKAGVHFGDSAGDAQWDKDQQKFYFADGFAIGDLIPVGYTTQVDIVCHEFLHAITFFTAKLSSESSLFPQGAALSESISDVFASMVKQYLHGQTVEQADWLIGVGAYEPKNPNSGLRSLKAPGKAWRIDNLHYDRGVAHMNQYLTPPSLIFKSSGDPVKDEEIVAEIAAYITGGNWCHENCGIPSHAFYVAAMNMKGKSWGKIGQIWYAALQDPRLQPLATDRTKDSEIFKHFAECTNEHAKLLYDQPTADIVRNAWVSVGVLPAPKH